MSKGACVVYRCKAVGHNHGLCAACWDRVSFDTRMKVVRAHKKCVYWDDKSKANFLLARGMAGFEALRDAYPKLAAQMLIDEVGFVVVFLGVNVVWRVPANPSSLKRRHQQRQQSPRARTSSRFWSALQRR